MNNRYSRIRAKTNGYHGRKAGKGKSKKKPVVYLYVEKNRPGWQAPRHLLSFPALDRYRPEPD